MKLRVWIESPDNSSFSQEDYIELPDNLSDDELEEIAKQVAMAHIRGLFGKDLVKVKTIRSTLKL